MSKTHTGHAASAQVPFFVFRHLLRLEGLADTGVLAEAGLSNDDIDSIRYISIEQCLILTSRIKKLLGSDAWGYLLGKTVSQASLGAYGYAVLAAPDLRQSLRLWVSYAPLGSPFLRFNLVEQDDLIRFEFISTIDENELAAGITEFVLCMMYRQITTAFPQYRRALQINYKGAEPSHSEELNAFFGASSIRFNENCFSLSLPREIYTAPSALYEPSVYHVAERSCYQQLAKVQPDLESIKMEDIVSQRIDSCIAENLNSGIPNPVMTQSEMAAYLGMSEASLRRKLQQSGETFRRIKERCRVRWLDELLEDTSLSVQLIGLVLGYDNASNFARACRRWKGCSPGMLREESGN